MIMPNALRPHTALAAGVLLAVACTSAVARGPAALGAPAAISAPVVGPPVVGPPVVGPPNGTVIVVGGGGQGPEITKKFIELAGGPNALIILVPAAGGDTAYAQDYNGTRMWEAAGAKNLWVLHTNSRGVANSDKFVEPITRAGGVWFDGGRQFHLVDLYANTKTEKAFHDLLARGGVAAGSSAGASILGDFLVRGAPSSDNSVMDDPRYQQGFAFLRGVGIDQHVVARERLPDLADSIIPRHKVNLAISEDEGTAWMVHGDNAEIIGRNKAFVYGGNDANDPGVPFVTLRPGDRYNLAAKRVTHRAIDESKLTSVFIDDLFADFRRSNGGQATVLVAQNGKVFVNTSYGVPAQARYMPTTTVPNFPLLGLSDGFNASAALAVIKDGKLKLDDSLVEPGTGRAGGAGGGAGGGAPTTVRQYLSHTAGGANGGRQFADLLAKRSGGAYSALVARRIMAPIGMHKTIALDDGQWQSNVDELYRWELGLTQNPAFTSDSTSGANVLAPVGASPGNALGWWIDSDRGRSRQSEFGTRDGKRNAFVRYPSERAVIIILTDRFDFDARGTAQKIADRLLF
jgi:cyanophycinase